MNKLNARKATLEDIDKLLKLQSQYLYSSNKDLLDGNTGLINNKFSYNDIKNCIESKDSIVILLENSYKEILAYIISIGFNQMKNTKPELIRIVSETNNLQSIEDVLLIEHIVIHKKTGAFLLLNALYNEGKDQYNHVCGEIMTFPVQNKVSKKFFTFLKGEIIGSIRYKNNTIWDVFYSPVRNNFRSFIS